VVIELIFIGVIMCLEYLGPMGLGLVCYDSVLTHRSYLSYTCKWGRHVPASGIATCHVVSFSCSFMWSSDVNGWL